MRQKSDAFVCLQLSPNWNLQINGVEVVFPGLRAKALVTYLALEMAKSHSREKLANLLWSDVDTQKARTSLRQVLSGLRKTLPNNGAGFLELSRDNVGLAQNTVVTSIDHIASEISSGNISQDSMNKVAKLENILAEFETISPEFEEWISDVRGLIVRHSIGQLKTFFLNDKHSPEQRILAAQTSHKLDDLDEDAVRTMMSVHSQMGNSAAALKIYGEFYNILENELDAEPSIKTQDLAVKIKLAQECKEATSSKTLTRTTHLADAPPNVTVAVVPFETLVPGSVEDHVLVGLLDHITCQLAANQAPAVISSNTTRRYLGYSPQPSEVGQDLNADYIVSGMLRVDQKNASVTVQLSSTNDNRVVWAHTYDCVRSELYSVKTPIVDDIVRAITPSVNIEELKRTISTPLELLEPYHLVLRAKDLIFSLERSAFDEAGALLHQAVDSGPHYAPAHALLAEWFTISIWHGWSSNPDSAQLAMDKHVRRAVSLSPGNGRALAMWGHNRMLFNREYDEALLHFEKALEICPNDSETLIWTVPTLAWMGDSEKAVELGTRAVNLSPLDPFTFRNEHFLSVAHYACDNFDSSAELGLSCFQTTPNLIANVRTTIAALVASDRVDESKHLVAHHNKIVPDFSTRQLFHQHRFKSEESRATLCERLLAAGLPK